MTDIFDILERGGPQRIAFLRYCVLSVSMEPMFVFLVQEYRYRSSHAAALALFDLFCARQAPARLAADDLLPPRELLVEAAIGRIRAEWMQMYGPKPPGEISYAPQPPGENPQARETPGADSTAVFATPARELFDAIVRGLRQDAHGGLARIGSTYDPLLTPEENLPGGKLNAGQRYFVEGIWQPIVKPRLVAAGFWRIATIG